MKMELIEPGIHKASDIGCLKITKNVHITKGARDIKEQAEWKWDI